MRRIEDSDTGYLPTVTLYRQDIDEIAEIIRGTTPDGKLSIRSGNFAFDSLDELQKERGDVVHQLKLEGGQGSRLEIEPRKVDLQHLPEAEERRIASILKQQRRWLGGGQELVGWVVSFAGWTILIAVLINLLWVGVTAARLLTLPPLLVLSVAFTFLPPRSRVFLVRRHEHKTFWRRHQGEFVKAGLVLVGTALGYWLRGYFGP